MNAISKILNALRKYFRSGSGGRTRGPDEDVYAAIGLAISNAMR